MMLQVFGRCFTSLIRRRHKNNADDLIPVKRRAFRNNSKEFIYRLFSYAFVLTGNANVQIKTIFFGLARCMCADHGFCASDNANDEIIVIHFVNS